MSPSRTTESLFIDFAIPRAWVGYARPVPGADASGTWADYANTNYRGAHRNDGDAGASSNTSHFFYNTDQAHLASSRIPWPVRTGFRTSTGGWIRPSNHIRSNFAGSTGTAIWLSDRANDTGLSNAVPSDFDDGNVYVGYSVAHRSGADAGCFNLHRTDSGRLHAL